MYEPKNYEIREVGESLFGAPHPGVRLDVTGLESLPAALRRLAEMGHDMTSSLEVLSEAVEEQRKRKALDEAVKAIATPAK